MITWENYEEYMMMHADGELSPAEEQALMSFVYEHPELANELAAFSMSKMIPDTTMVYANKKALLKKEPAKVVAFPNWQRYAIAAGVAALLFVAGVNTFYNKTNDTPAIATNTPTTKETQKTETPMQETPEATTPPAPQQESIAAIPSPVHNTQAAPNKILKVKPTTVKQKAITIKPETQNAVAQAKENVERVPAEYIAMAEINYTEIFSPVAVTNVPPATINITEEGETKSFIDKLPISDLKKDGMRHVATAMASGYDKVNAIRQEINEATITVKVEKRKLILSF